MTSVTFKQDTVVKAPAYLKVKEVSSPPGFVRVAHICPDVLDVVLLPLIEEYTSTHVRRKVKI